MLPCGGYLISIAYCLFFHLVQTNLHSITVTLNSVLQNEETSQFFQEIRDCCKRVSDFFGQFYLVSIELF